MARARAAALILGILLVAACAAAPAASESGVPTSAPASPTATRMPPAASTTPQPSAAPIDPTALAPGGLAMVVADEPLVLQPEPGIGDQAGILPDRLSPYMRVGIVEGPVEADGYQWYRVRSGAVEGWAAATSREGEPWLAGVHDGLIAFALSPADGSMPQVYTVAADGSGVRQVTSFRSDDPLLDPTTGLASAPAPALSCANGIQGMAWSPGGERLALGIGGCEQVVLTLTLDGDVRRLAAGSLPRWSPDGGRLVFQLNVPYAPCGLPCLEGRGPWEVHAVSAAGGTPEPLTDNDDPFAAQQPDLSPDGMRLAFSGPARGGGVDDLGVPRSAIFVANADGSEQLMVAEGTGPRWSPNSKRLLIVGPDGQVAVLEASGDASRTLGVGVGAAWSPDGTRVAFTTIDGGASSTQVVAIEGDASAVTLPGRFAAWSPDGRHVLLVVPREGGGLTLQRAPAGGGAGEALVGIDDGELTDAAWQPLVVVPTVDG